LSGDPGVLSPSLKPRPPFRKDPMFRPPPPPPPLLGRLNFLPLKHPPPSGVTRPRPQYEICRLSSRFRPSPTTCTFSSPRHPITVAQASRSPPGRSLSEPRRSSRFQKALRWQLLGLGGGFLAAFFPLPPPPPQLSPAYFLLWASPLMSDDFELGSDVHESAPHPPAALLIIFSRVIHRSASHCSLVSFFFSSCTRGKRFRHACVMIDTG